ncbi:MAG: bifunctional (p)ppGpp synthetase/guanosine-3',5'-bis(diphosphate) 3'-pyrophosphohydrolase [Alphaproteobacteria bacterium]|nr:bifunctional (p)ppGpp synthetase/guanosine-3',5'-bis(diphosphate) 3'-pyrophosphohydrolase [Alphaproteobacteria bacterium]
MIRQFELIQRLKSYCPDMDEELINKAYVFAMKAHGSQVRASGDPYFSHPLEVAGILVEMHLDPASIVTGLLHDTVEDTLATLEDIQKLFGDEIARLVDGVTKLSRLELQSEETKQAENFRKLVLAMSTDIRVLIVKLADRLHNMRTLYHVDDGAKRRRIARETMEIYVPLAERIGMQGVKDELEDLAFATLNPEARESILSRLRYLHETSDNQVETILFELRKVLDEHHITASISGREKTPYSIWRKMHMKNVAFEQLSDIMAFRIVCEAIPECYQILGILHNAYSVIPGKFKDYMSTPKANGYSSLHTSLIGPLNQRIEAQIRTKEMHAVAELGVAAHWQYKQGASLDGKQYAWLRGLLDILEHTSNPQEFLEHTKLEMFQDQVFCFTPKGDVIALPKGATTIDFAYALHSQIGDHTIAARVNGRQMPLRTILHNGDQVDIVTSKTQNPSPTWERFVVTGKARACIRRFTRQQQKNQFLELGKSLLHKAFSKEHIDYTEDNLKIACEIFHYTQADDLISDVGHGHRTAKEIAQSINNKLKNTTTEASLDEKIEQKFDESNATIKKQKVDTKMSIKGLIPGMALHYAGCCHPIPGDKITGLVVTGKGVTIHTVDCALMADFEEPERLLDLSWNDHLDDTSRFVARILITFVNRPGSLAHMTTMISKQGGNIANLKVTHRTPEFWDVFVDVEIKDQHHLDAIIAGLRTVPVISHVERGK